MAQRLISALKRGAGKTIKEQVSRVGQQATRDIPSPKSFYNLGMGIGPFIRNAVGSYNQNPQQITNKNKESQNNNTNLGFAKDNLVTQKNIAGQLSALTSIMSDIRKISLAQLNLQRTSIGRKFGDSTEYSKRESILERISPMSGLSSTQEQNKGGGIGSFFMNNPGISAGLLGILALANAKNIQQFMQDTGLNKALTEGTQTAVTAISNAIASTIKQAIVEGIPALYTSIKSDIVKSIRSFLAGDAQGGIKSATSATATSAAIGGALYGLKTGKGLGGKIVKGAVGGTVGFFGAQAAGSIAGDAITPGSTPEQNEKQSSAQTTLGVLAAAGVGLGAYKAFGGGKATPSAPPTGTTAPPPSGSVETKGVRSIPPGKPLTDFGEVGAKRAAAAEMNNKSSFSRTLALLRKLIEKMGLQRVMAFLALRIGIATAAGASGFLAGPVGVITTLLSYGIMLYTIYDVLMELDKQTDNSNVNNSSNNLSNVTPGQSPSATSSDSSPPPSDNKSNQNPSKGIFDNPVPSATDSKGRFGENRGSHAHTGVDISAPEGAPVLSVEGGKVIEVGSNAGYGNYVVVEHPNGMKSKYGHLSTIDVKKDTMLKKGQQLGKVGSTGQSEGPHLHLDIINPDGNYLNPRDYVKNIPKYTGKDDGTNPEGSVSMLAGGKPSNMTGDSPSAPGSSTNQAFASVFGFDPSKMVGGDLAKVLSGDQLAKLNALQNDMKTGSNELAKLTNMAQSPVIGPTNPAANPAPQRRAENARSKEKDFLFNTYQNSDSVFSGMA